MDVDKELKKRAEKRQQFVYQGKLVYEWDQTLDDVNVYIKVPPFLLKKYAKEYEKQLKPGQKLPKLEITIGPKKLSVGMTGNPPYLDVLLCFDSLGRVFKGNIGQREPLGA
jgi:hypothetical protein